MSALGAELPIRNVRASVAIGGNADPENHRRNSSSYFATLASPFLETCQITM
jgi:hypothetical protein